MKPTEILMNEHRVIEQVLDCLEKMADQCESKGVLDAVAAEDAVFFFKNFADLRHHKKEEDRLFPLAESRGVPRAGGPIGVMLVEHADGRERIADIQESINKSSGGDKGAQRLFVEESRAYIRLLREHIQKEDECLFPMSDRALSSEDQEALMRSFEATHTEEVDKANQIKCLEISRNLAEKYHVSEVNVELKW